MKKNLITLSIAMACSLMAFGQGAIDAYRISQPDMKGTARFMSMGGAFTALGGDLSTLSQNPAGIGVYRSGEVGFSVDLDFQSSNALSQGFSADINQTKFLLNNIGAVVTMRLPGSVLRNLNFGFTYNKGASFNRQYVGKIPSLNTSVSNYIAGISNSNQLTVGDVTTTNSFDPYNPSDGGYAAPWLSILGYDSYMVTPSGEGEDTRWFGQWGDNTSGNGNFGVKESGSIDDYNIAFGGNVSDVLFWGMNFNIVSLNYTLNSIWNESLQNAYVPDSNDQAVITNAETSLSNYYNVNGTGFSYQLGFIVKPIQEFRLGVAVHTPTWYSLTENYSAGVNYNYGNGNSGNAYTDNGYTSYNNMDFRTPWKVMFGAAGVIGGQFILSADYEWTPYNKMKLAAAGSYGIANGGGGGGWDWDYPDWYYSSKPEVPTRSYANAFNEPYYDENSDIRTYYQASNTFRLGAEYRVTPSFSVRAGYSHVSSPVKEKSRNDGEIIYTSGTLTNYRFDNSTDYITCGIGYKYSRFYVDLAYVYKNMKSTYHAFSPDVSDTGKILEYSPQSSLSLCNSQVVLSAGFRF